MCLDASQSTHPALPSLLLLLLLLPFQPVKRTEHRRPGGKKAVHVFERSELWAAPTWPRSAGDRLAQPAGSRPGVLSSWLLLLCTSKEEVTRQSRVAAGETMPCPWAHPARGGSVPNLPDKSASAYAP